MPDREIKSRIPTLDFLQLRKSAETHFDTACVECIPFADGGFHELYLLKLEINPRNATSGVIARVAFPVLPRDKLTSEVATIKYLASNTDVPVPKIFSWNADASNPVGAEYMLMEKLPGVSAQEAWNQFSFELRIKFMDQVAHYMHQIFTLRFDRIGSLYFSNIPTSDLSSDTNRNNFKVGPLVSTTFFEDYEETGPTRTPVTTANRGPYANAFEWLASLPRAELAYMETHPAEARQEDSEAGSTIGLTVTQAFDRAKLALEKAVNLASIYGGSSNSDDPAISAGVFSLRHFDLRLVNILVDPSSADITGLVDWEATGSAPLWACALMPWWIINQGDGGTLDGGEEGKRQKVLLRTRFMEKMDEMDALVSHPSLLWRRASIEGDSFRRCLAVLQLQWPFWVNSGMDKWLEKTKAWAKEHPGLGRPEDEL